MDFAICFLYVWSPYTLVFEQSYGARQWNVVVMIYVREGVPLIAGVFFAESLTEFGWALGFFPVLKNPSF